jgi:hypothetical protein
MRAHVSAVFGLEDFEGIGPSVVSPSLQFESVAASLGSEVPLPDVNDVNDDFLSVFLDGVGEN